MWKLLLILVFAWCDRQGGGGFGWLGAKGWFASGHKEIRRFGIPALVWLLNPSWDQAILCVAMGAILSFNLKEIQQRDWEEVFLHGFGLSAVLYPIAGIGSLAVALWWILGVYWSNIGILRHKLGWHWVELVRGSIIGALIG